MDETKIYELTREDCVLIIEALTRMKNHDHSAFAQERISAILPDFIRKLDEYHETEEGE